MFGSIEEEGKTTHAVPKHLDKSFAEAIFLEALHTDETYKLLLCYDRKSRRYQLWKKFKPKWLRGAVTHNYEYAPLSSSSDRSSNSCSSTRRRTPSSGKR